MSNKVFNLFMLGTETVYTPNPDDKYPHGETLSVIATLIDNKLVSYDNGESFSSSHVRLFNGPDLAATKVNKLIKRGVCAVLDAVAQGKNVVNILGHSRGANIGLLIAHCINDIQEKLKEGKTATEIFTALHKEEKEIQSNTGFLFEIPSFITKKLEDLERSKTLSNLLNVELNLSLLDPVPGDPIQIDSTSSGIKKNFLHVTVNWYDPRFFKIPGIVKKAEVIYYPDELTLGFAPTYPAPTNENHFHDTIPGHHGTGSSGNNTDQQNNPLKEPYNVKHVQKLVFLKKIFFLLDNGVRFADQALFTEKLKKGKSLTLRNRIQRNWDKFQKGLTLKDIAKVRSALLLRAYEKIGSSSDSYEILKRNNYRGLGKLDPYSRQIQTSIDSNSIVNYQPLSSIIHPQDIFVNKEHAYLAANQFFKPMGIQFKRNVSFLLLNLINKILGEIKSKKADLSDNSQNAEIIFRSFAAFIQEIVANYIGKNRPDKIEAFKAFGEMFEAVTEVLQENESTFKNELLLHLIGVTNESLSKYKATLLRKVNYFEYLTTDEGKLESAFTKFIYSKESDEFISGSLIFDLKNEMQLTKDVSDFEIRKNNIRIKLAENISLDGLEAFFDVDLFYSAKALYKSLIMAEQEMDAFRKIPILSEYINTTEIRKKIDALIHRFPKIVEDNSIVINADIGLVTPNTKAKCTRAENFFMPRPYNLSEETAKTRLIERAFSHLKQVTLVYFEHLRGEKLELIRENGDLDHINQKIDMVKELLSHLKPGDKKRSMKLFYENLGLKLSVLQSYRNPVSHGFISALIAVSILLTGVIPGIFALAIYSSSSPIRSMFFWRSKGQNYLNNFENDSLIELKSSLALT